MPKNVVRTFIGIGVTPTAEINRVLRQLKKMGDAIRPVSVEQLHLTLKFLGDVFFSSIPDLCRAVEESAAQFPVMELRMSGLGAFPRKERPSVIWAGFDAAESLVELAADVEARCEALGWAAEQRPYHPHLTLARVRRKPPDALAKLFAEHAETDFGTLEIDSVQVYQSERSSSGSQYTVLSSSDLGG
ncbi:MAG: RNA 2',3'-cyclic phosphodiesterase [Planctomycetaceae bacterium]